MKKIRLTETDLKRIVKRVIKENSPSNLMEIGGMGKQNYDVGRIVRKIYQKRNGEKVIKYFYVSQKKPDFKIVLCGIYEYLSHLVNKPNRLVSIEWKGMGTPGGSHPNSPCTSPVELQMKEYVEPEKEDVDDWWNNEITGNPDF